MWLFKLFLLIALICSWFPVKQDTLSYHSVTEESEIQEEEAEGEDLAVA